MGHWRLISDWNVVSLVVVLLNEFVAISLGGEFLRYAVNSINVSELLLSPPEMFALEFNGPEL